MHILKLKRIVQWVSRSFSDTPGEGGAPPLNVADVHRMHANFVWKSLQRLGVHFNDLEDMQQEVFVIVHRKLPGYDASMPMSGWLFGICRKVAAAYRRKAHRRYEEATGEWDDQADLKRLDPEKEAESSHARRQLDLLLERLDLDKRAVFVMFEIDGLSCEEIAEQLGVPVGTVYSRLHTARKIFQKAVEKNQKAVTAPPPLCHGDLAVAILSPKEQKRGVLP